MPNPNLRGLPRPDGIREQHEHELQHATLQCLQEIVILLRNGNSQAVLALRDSIELLRKDIQAMNQEVKTLIADFNTETNRLSEVVGKLVTDNANDLDADQLAELTALRDRLRAIGSDPNQPIPPVPPTP